MYMYICNYAGFHSTDVHNYTELVYIHLPLHLLPLCRLVGKFMIAIPVATVCVLIGSFQRVLYHSTVCLEWGPAAPTEKGK